MTTRNRGSWTEDKRQWLDNIRQVVRDFRQHWPLTLRQVYYQLVKDALIENKLGEYKKLSRILTQARLDGLVSWSAIEDRARSTLRSDQDADPGDFVESWCNAFLRGYVRDKLQSQPVRLELWVEKDALSRLVQVAAKPYGVPVVVARGFSSVSYVRQCFLRVRDGLDHGKATRILYFGDMDPSGYEMLPSMLVTLQDEMGLGDHVQATRCALTTTQIERFNLPHDPSALKWTDSRATKYVQQFGRLAVELDALSPDQLQSIVVNNIRNSIDLDLYQRECDQEDDDKEKVDELRESAMVHIDDERERLGL